MLLIAAANNLTAIAQNIGIEVMAGPELKSVRGSKPFESIFGQNINLTTGIGIAYELNENSYINTKVLYERKGGRNKYDLRDANNQNAGKATYSANFDYIAIPVQYRREFGGKIRFQAGAGMYGGYLAESTIVTRSSNTSIGENSTTVDTKSYKRIDLGLTASINTYIPLNQSLKLVIGINDNIGLINTSDVKLADGGSIKHNSVALTAGINCKL